jgi:FlaA1/EpsC-like NDP-sugar epimerase
MKPTLVRLLALPRPAKQLVLVLSDLLALPLLFWLALALRYDTIDPIVLPGVPFGLALTGVLASAVLMLCGVYRAVVRAFDERFLQNLLLSVVLIVSALFALASVRALPMPRSVPFIYGFFVFLWVWASRSTIRTLVQLMVRVKTSMRRVAIYGAGTAGRQILAALRAAPEYLPVAFFDDAPGLAGTTVQGLRVYRSKDFARQHRLLSLEEVLIALPSVTRARRREVIKKIEPFQVRVRTLPAVSQLVGGQVSISDIREVDITDLLGRDPVPPHRELLGKDISGKRVMVTGAGGSIGSELCRQVLAIKPKVLVLCDVSEFALYNIEQELRTLVEDTKLVAVLGSVLHQARMAHVMKEHRIDTVYHAAAYKHVPIVESNPFEGIVNNTVGTYRAAKAAIAAGVATFVLISTDKAVRPTNVMGASKRLAELVLQALAAEPHQRTRFCMVRFGNVLGSSGSVVPLFREQIAKGGPVTVTHPEVTRYFMTIPEASQLVIQAGAMGEGGDVFVLDMGESVKIVDLARNMIRLSGMSVREATSDPDGDIEIVFTGLRPGEKLYEELLIGSNVSATDHPRIMRAMEKRLPLARMEALVSTLVQLAKSFDEAGLKVLLHQVVEGYPETEHSDSGTIPTVHTAVESIRAQA